jgi:hypothetical protein
MQVLLKHSASGEKDKAVDTHANPFVSLQLLRELAVPAAVQHGNLTTYFALNERIVAAESCWFAAKVREVMSPMSVLS